jgi:ABC-type antimicrobial peptide transport system permease subunit
LSAEPIELFVPFTMRDTYTSRSGAFANVRRVFAIGRLKPGVTLAQASSELESISQSLATEHPTLYRRGSDGRELGFVMSAEPLRIAVAGAAPRILLLLSAAVGLVLLIACVNTAHFLLARAIERQQEVAVRSALGASRGRLVRQFLSEAALLAVTAAAAGLLQAAWLLDIVNASLSSRATIAGAVGMNAAVMTFTAGLALGMAAAVAASGALRALLRGLTHLDAATVAAIGAFYLLVVAVAVCIPAVRALRLDPAAVLRSE